MSIPSSVPILPYSYRRPASLRNMVARLLHKIDPSLLIKPETRFAGTPKPLKIAVVGLADPQDRMDRFHDPMLYPAFMLMSLNLDEATYHTDENGFDHTLPLRFDFTQQTFVFSRPTTMSNIAEHLRDVLLPSCDGVIVSVSGANSHTPAHQLSFLKEIYAHIYTSKLPTIFVPTSGAEWIIREAKQVLNVPENIPFIPYHYDEPISLQHILTTLLAEIDKANLAKKES